jgi:anti-sigma B factor antagonist
MPSFTAREDADVLLISFDGSSGLNDFRNNSLREALYELVTTRDEPRFAVNLNKVDYLSSSGVAILVGLKRRVEAKGGKLFLYCVQPIVFDLLAVMKLDEYFSIVAEEEEAIASLRSVPTA